MLQQLVAYMLPATFCLQAKSCLVYGGLKNSFVCVNGKMKNSVGQGRYTSNQFQNSFISKWKNEKLGPDKQSIWNGLMGEVYSIAGKGFKIFTDRRSSTFHGFTFHRSER